jgi:hypothetical protein
MMRLILVGVCLVVGVEAFAISRLDRLDVIVVSGVAVAGVLLVVRWYLAHHDDTDAGPSVADDAGAGLRRWQSRTETLISWSESSRSDWDRRLRPMLARQFELATGQRKVKDPNAFRATGRMLFGPALWQWVDPENISRTGGQEPGPGREALNDILRRLEQL